MIDNTICENCNHIKGCGKKDKYEKYLEGLNKFCISSTHQGIMYAKDDVDIALDLRCKHYEKNTPIGVR